MAAWQKIKGRTGGTNVFASVCSAVDEVCRIIPDAALVMAGGRSELSTLICNDVSKEPSNRAKLHSIIHY